MLKPGAVAKAEVVCRMSLAPAALGGSCASGRAGSLRGESTGVTLVAWMKAVAGAGGEIQG